MPLIYLWIYTLVEGLIERISSVFDKTSKALRKEDGDR